MSREAGRTGPEAGRRSALLTLALAACAPLAACSPTRLLNEYLPEETHERTDNVAYGRHPRQQLDIYQPRPTADRRHGWPVVVFFYGGSWNSGARSTYRFVGEALASRGILTLVADYRLYPEVAYPDFLHDCARAVAWALAQAERWGGDPRSLHVVGHSAGGYNAAMLALDERWLSAADSSPDRLASWIGLAGPYDFQPIINRTVQPVFQHPNYPPRSQPIEHVRSGAPPTFIGAAESDGLVDPQRNARQLAGLLRKADVPVTEALYPRANHITLIGAMARPLRWIAPVLDDVSDFVHEHSRSTVST